MLDFFGVTQPQDMQCVSLGATIAEDAPTREAVIFGIHGSHINVTDGRYIYMHAPDVDKPYFNYTLMPAHMLHYFTVDELASATLSPPLPFTKGAPILKIPVTHRDHWQALRSHLFDLTISPDQTTEIDDETVVSRMKEHIVRLMQSNAAQSEMFVRFRFNMESTV